jgi:hypothetical protein
MVCVFKVVSAVTVYTVNSSNENAMYNCIMLNEKNVKKKKIN